MRKVQTYAIHDVEPYINWLYFYHAWQVGQKGAAEREALDEELLALYEQWEELNQ